MRTMGLEFLKGDRSAVIGIDLVEYLPGPGGILPGAWRGFEFLKADGAAAIGIELLESLLGMGMSFPAFSRFFLSVGKRGGDGEDAEGLNAGFHFHGW